MTRLELAFVVAMLAVARSASAEEPEEPYRAKFDEGRALVKANKYADALDKFQESLALKEASGTLLNIGDCQEHLGRYASAAASFERARALAADSKQADREKEAADRAAKLAGSVSKILVKAPDGVKVTVDGAAAELGKAVLVDGGSHVVHAEASCKRGRDFPVSVGSKADEQTVNVDPATFDPDPACNKPAPEAMSTERILSYVAGGAGVVAAGIGIGFGVSAAGKKSDLEAICPTYPDRCALGEKPALDAKYDDAHSAATISTIAFTGAILFIAGGVALYILSPEWQKTHSSAFVPGRWYF